MGSNRGWQSTRPHRRRGLVAVYGAGMRTRVSGCSYSAPCGHPSPAMVAHSHHRPARTGQTRPTGGGSMVTQRLRARPIAGSHGAGNARATEQHFSKNVD